MIRARSAESAWWRQQHAVAELLESFSEPVRLGVLEALDGGETCPFGDLLQDYPRRGGKGLRPTLLIAAARVYGGDLDDALPAAVALEILHTAQLVHDDIEDQSLERRGGPAMHRQHGIPIAVCAGDALAFRSLRPLLDSRRLLGDRTTLRLFEEAGRMMNELVAGQALELGWRDENIFALQEEDYLEMVLKKTCWLSTIFPLRAGALIGSRGTVDLEPLIRFGFFLGAAFQIQDDLLNLVGDSEHYGKEIDGDLWEGKWTLMLIRLFNQSDVEQRERLEAIFALRRSERRTEDLVWVRRRLEETGCLEYARDFAHGLAGSALAEFQRIWGRFPPSKELEMIEGLVHWVLGRAR